MTELDYSDRGAVDLVGRMVAVPIETSHVEIVYDDTNDGLVSQPLVDVQDSGTLLDSETDADADVIAARVPISTVPQALALALQERADLGDDPESAHTAQWILEHGDDDGVWQHIGGLLDTITDMAR